MATQRAMKCNLFRLGITPREDTIRLTRRTPRSNRGPMGREREREREGRLDARAPRARYTRAMGMRRNRERSFTAGPPCSIPENRDRRTMFHLNLLSALYSAYPVGFLLRRTFNPWPARIIDGFKVSRCLCLKSDRAFGS